MSYSDIAWWPLVGGLTLLGLIASWVAWRRRGAAAGLRGAAWSLLPIAAYLTGVISLLWKFGTAIGSFATSFVFSPKVWSGLIVTGAAALLFVVSGWLRRGRRAKRAGAAPARPAAGGGTPAAQITAGQPPAGKPATKAPQARGAPAADDDFAEIEQILRRRNIR